MPATANGMRKNGAPILLKFWEQKKSDTSRMMPSPYTLRDAVSFTGLPCPFATVLPRPPTLSARPLFVVPSPENDVIPQPAARDRQLRRCRKNDLQDRPTVQEIARETRVCPERCWCPSRRPRRVDGTSLPLPDSSPHRVSARRPSRASRALRTSPQE